MFKKSKVFFYFMGNDLGMRYFNVRRRNERRFFAPFSRRIQRNIKQARQGCERQREFEHSFKWIEDVLNDIYGDCDREYFYDMIKIREGCVRAVELLRGREMGKSMYKKLSSSIREGEAGKYLMVLNK